MRERPDVLVNAHGGERVIVRRRPHTPRGPLEMTLELTVPGAGPPAHAHPRQTERFRVRRGALAVSVEGSQRELRAGDECVIPPGSVHRWVVLEPSTEVELAVQPALRFEEVLERAFELVDRGAVGPQGIIDAEPVEAFVAEFADEYRLVAP